jgi:hypothetical protein
LRGAKAVEAIPLDGEGKPRGPAVGTARGEGAFELRLEGTQAMWYVLEVRR